MNSTISSTISSTMDEQLVHQSDTNCAADQKMPQGMRPPVTTGSPSSSGEIEQENGRLQLALRELRHRCCNQWQLLLGLVEMERVQPPQPEEGSCSVRLHSMLHAYAMLNRSLDSNVGVLTGHQTINMRAHLESLLTLLQATTGEDSLYFTVQDAWMTEKGGAALMLICTELVCNATKYGRHTTSVSLRTEGAQGILEVRDDGPGFPHGFRVEEQSRQGLQLVEALCRCDLSGGMRCHNEAQGGVVTLTFPVPSVPFPSVPVSSVPTVIPSVEDAAVGDAAVGGNVSFCAMEGIICSPDILLTSDY